MSVTDIKNKIRAVPDFPKPGIMFRDNLLQMFEQAIRLAKDFNLRYEVNPSSENEINLAKLFFQYLIENGTISDDMADVLTRRMAANE